MQEGEAKKQSLLDRIGAKKGTNQGMGPLQKPTEATAECNLQPYNFILLSSYGERRSWIFIRD